MATCRAISIASALMLVVAGAGCSERAEQGANGAPPAVPVVETVDLSSVSWPIFRGNAALDGVAEGEIPDDIVLRWTFPAEQAIASSPVVADGRVYVGSDDGNLYALELATGELIWSFASEDIIEAPPLVHDGVVYVGSSDFFFYAIDAETGTLLWKHETNDRVLGGANIIEGAGDEPTRIIVGSYDNRLYCFDPSGTVLWTYETDNYVNGTPAVVGTSIVFGGCDSALHIVDGRTGEGLTRMDLGVECYVGGSVGVADGHVYFGHYGNAFVCVNLETTETIWEYLNPRFPFFSSPSIGTDRVVFGGRDKRMHCVRRHDGEPQWTFPTRRKVDGSPVVCGDKVVFGSGDGRVYVLDLLDGTELWSYDIGRSIFSSPAVAGGLIIIGSNDGQVYAFGARPSTDGEVD